MDRVTELLDGWRVFADWQRDVFGRPGPRKWNAHVDRLTALAEVAVGVPAEVARLREIAETHPDDFVRREARFWVHPPVPRPPEREHLDRWLRHPLVDLAGSGVEPRAGVVLLTDRYTSPESITWYGGAGEQIAQLGLPGSPMGFEPWTLLPEDGVLRFFRDGRVIHVPAPDDDQDDEPEHHRPDGARPATAIDVWTFPDALESANRRLVRTVFSNWGLEEDYGPVHPLPTILGVTRDDGHRRLLHLPGVLDIWIPEEDLLQRDFSRTYTRSL
ncbi:hypothetical protein [Actinoplanes sp. G11-F43]|uniref:hypothetical protein n=1 Tax=Actinoplanes sp. G11-F43 TaxID=3424130 RepID=UPI003D351F40